jgi:hypothetical protein
MDAMRMRLTLTTVTAVGMVVLGILTLAAPPHARFSGSGADYAADAVWAVLLAVSVPALVALGRGSGRAGRAAAAAAALGQAALALSVAATVAAGREVLDALFVAGFALELVGLVVLAAAARRAVVLALVPGLVIALALFGHGGTIALGAAWLAVGHRTTRAVREQLPRRSGPRPGSADAAEGRC